MKVKKALSCFLMVAVVTYLWNFSKVNRNTSREKKTLQSEYNFTDLPSEPRFRYGEVQVLSDNSTVVYVGYYDTREAVAFVKIPAHFDTKNKLSSFTCTVHYTNKISTKVDSKIRLFTYSWHRNTSSERYRTGMFICPVSREHDIPSYVLLTMSGINNGTTNITVKAPAKKNNTLTRCIKHFVNNYDNVTQLVWNIEFYRILGVDKQIFYLCSQSQRVLDVLKLYEEDGTVELRNFHLETLPVKFSKLKILQNMVLGECILSEMTTAKYVLVVDVDEIVFPKAHKDIVEMADFLFEKGDPKGRPLGSLRFRLAFYPVDINVTDVSFPNKDIAKNYNIHPLLYSKRYKTFSWAAPKSLVKPMSVDVMFVHVVETFINDDRELMVDDDIGVVNHYRKGTNKYLQPPLFTNTEVFRFSEDLIAAVGERYRGLDRNGNRDY